MAATLRSFAIGTRSIQPRSISEYDVVETPAFTAATRCGQPTRMRSARKTRPIAMSSTGARIARSPYPSVIGKLPALLRPTKRPKPRSPTKAPSRMTGRPRTNTDPTEPVSWKPSYGV
jgi:hypothetical protein